MSKTIWLREETYDRLTSLRVGRETFNDIIERLIRVFRAIQRVPYAQSGEDFYREEPLTDARAKETADVRRDSKEMPDMSPR